jgi:hypothetical protein
MIGVRDLVQRIGDGHTGRILSGRTIKRSGDIVYGLHHAREDEKREFLGRASKPRSTVCQWFGIKTTGTVFSGLASKPVVTVSLGLASKPVARVPRIGPQNQQLWFGDLSLKISFLVWTSKPSGLWFIDCATKSTEGGRHGTRIEI